MIKKSLTVLIALAMPLMAQDVILLKDGTNRVGEIDSADDSTLKLRVPLSGSSPQLRSGTATATVSIPRADIEAIEFQPDPARDIRLRTATPDRTSAIESDWKLAEPWLSIPRSPAGSIGCTLAELLVASGDKNNALAAIDLFKRIEKDSWSSQDKIRAKQGRLRAMISVGRITDALAEAKQLAAETEDPEILIEANFIMAQAAEADFKAFLEENPRWEEDPYVINTRHELYNRVLELYLYPSLFFGSDDARAARGLWGAVGIYKLTQQIPLAIETARDIIALQPKRVEARLAEQYLATLKPEELASDFEAEARREQLEKISGTEEPASTKPVPKKENKPTSDKSKKPPKPKK